jgi:two-component system cell cycle sensor histidine kinase/response regulator CckA
MNATASEATILIVDDEPALLRLVTRVLEREGYRTLSAKAGDEAIVTFDKHRDEIDGVILDIVIPPNGVEEVFDHMMAARPGLGVGVVFVSGDEPEYALAEKMQLHGGVFLRKPFLPTALVKLVVQGLAARR